MPILATNIQKSRMKMPSVEITLVIDGEERTEQIRLSRAIVSPATRETFEETFNKTAPEKEEIVRALVMYDIQSPDIVDAEARPYPLDAEYLTEIDDSILLALWDSFQRSRLPNGMTSTGTSSG